MDSHLDSEGGSRRDFLKRGVIAAAGVAAGMLGGCNGDEECPVTSSAGAATAPQGVNAGFRFVHLTDIHVQPELRAGEGFHKCMSAVHALNPRPDFILTGGDLIMDALAADAVRATTLFDLFLSICRDSDIPFKHCIGNHDVLGWAPKRRVEPSHALYGKKMVQERLNLERTSYSFDHKGWRVAVVDDILPATNPEKDYEGGFSEADLDWLDRDLLAAGDRPKLLCTHVPIVSSVIFRGFNAAAPGVQNVAERSLTCRNAGAILKVLKERSVKLVLSGHLHENERIEYQGTTHIEDGAVCGAWWKGVNNGSPEGFGIIDVKADGTFEHQYHAYGWNA